MSKLIALALKDIKKAEADAGYVVDMGTWHTPTEVTCSTESGIKVGKPRKACIVCAAGSVMAFTLKTNPNKRLHAEDFGRNYDQLQAIDSLRTGLVNAASDYLGIKGDLNKFDTVIPEYSILNPKPFHTAMEKLQKKLEKAGY